MVDEVIFTSSSNDRALQPESMKKVAPRAVIADDAAGALRKAKAM